jgi:hypothetical protein
MLVNFIHKSGPSFLPNPPIAITNFKVQVSVRYSFSNLKKLEVTDQGAVFKHYAIDSNIPYRFSAISSHQSSHVQCQVVPDLQAKS